MARVLLVDDDQEMSRMIRRELNRHGHQVQVARSLKDSQDLVTRQSFDIVLLDLCLPDGSGLDVLSKLQPAGNKPEVIIMTAFAGPESAEIAINSGVWDYLCKPFSIHELRLILERALRYREKKSQTPHIFVHREEIIGESPGMIRCLDTMALAAQKDVSVLIAGETGTGKELFAEAIHQNSPRSKKGLVVLDCTVLSENLMESALFGHSKGAFTGAGEGKTGLMDQADGGTLFLDEIGELPLSLQKKLLRVLQERVYRPVGSRTEKKSNFRLISATNRDLVDMVETGAFREDLLHRIRSLTIELPPLRERTEDIKSLAEHQVRQLCQSYSIPTKTLSSALLDDLRAYAWPGNVREMLNVMDRMLTMARHESTLYPVHLPPQVRLTLAGRKFPDQDSADLVPAEMDKVDSTRNLQEVRKEMIHRFETKYLEQLLQTTGGDVKQACTISGLSSSQLYNLIKKYNIKR